MGRLRGGNESAHQCPSTHLPFFAPGSPPLHTPHQLPDCPWGVLAPTGRGPPCPGARRKTRLFCRNVRRRQVAGPGEVYGHSSGAPMVCLPPVGCSHGAVFIALSPWEPWPWRVSAAPQLPPSRGQVSGSWRPLAWDLSLEGNQLEPPVGVASTEEVPVVGGRPHGWWDASYFPGWSPAGQPVTLEPVLGSGSRPPGWERI